MSTHWTRRQFLTRVGAAAAAIQTFDHLDPCFVFAADAQTTDKDLFELKQVADGVYAVAAPRYKVNSNAAVILTNDGVVVVDSHSKPSAAQALYREIQGADQAAHPQGHQYPFSLGSLAGQSGLCGPDASTWKLSPPSAPKKT